LTRCPTHHPDGRQCLLPAHLGRCLIAKPGPASRDLRDRVAAAWRYPDMGKYSDLTAELLADTCRWMSEGGLDGEKRRVSWPPGDTRTDGAKKDARSALPSISAVVGEA
jgi:hypothetical protein